jgi:hypothetical protein
MNDFVQQKKSAAYVFAVLLLVPFIESVMIDYSFTLKDPRTTAKMWIEQNIVPGTKMLVDMPSHSPQLNMTKNQLQGLYAKAVELNNYKKEYLRLKLDNHPGEEYGYEIYQVKRSVSEVGAPAGLVEKAQEVQSLVDVRNGVAGLKKAGIRYVIVNSFDESGAYVFKNMMLTTFYDDVKGKCEVVKEFLPESKFQESPAIRICKLP